MKKCMVSFHIKNFSCHVILKRKLRHVGHSYVGHIRITLWVSGSNGSTGVTHCQPCSGCHSCDIQLTTARIFKARIISRSIICCTCALYSCTIVNAFTYTGFRRSSVATTFPLSVLSACAILNNLLNRSPMKDITVSSVTQRLTRNHEFDKQHTR